MDQWDGVGERHGGRSGPDGGTAVLTGTGASPPGVLIVGETAR